MVSQIRENDKPSKSWQDGGIHGSLAFPSICLAFKGRGYKVNRGGQRVHRTHTVDGKNYPVDR